MNIKRLKIDWNVKFDNTPSVQVLVDEIPTNLVYIDRHPLYFAERGGFVSFFYYQKPGDGYAGRAFNIETDKGSKVLRGPWSSNSNTMYAAGFPDTISVEITTNMADFKRGFTLLAGHMLFEVIEEAMKKYARGCVFASVGGRRTIVKRNLLPYLTNTQYPDLPHAGSPDLSSAQSYIAGYDTPIEKLVCGAYTESWRELGKPEDWLGCSLPAEHEGNHMDAKKPICGEYAKDWKRYGKYKGWPGCPRKGDHSGGHGTDIV